MLQLELETDMRGLKRLGDLQESELQWNNVPCSAEAMLCGLTQRRGVRRGTTNEVYCTHLLRHWSLSNSRSSAWSPSTCYLDIPIWSASTVVPGNNTSTI
ncbi:hypothetical protein KCU73_g35, partial [Aureobasidium melanogenum]